MKVRQYLKANPNAFTICGPNDDVADLAQSLCGYGACAIPVCDQDSTLIGIVSERDVVRAIGENNGTINDLKAKDIMTSPVVTCTPEDTMAQVSKIMRDRGFRNVPVVEDDAIIAVIGVRDALQIRLDQNQTEINVLKDTVIAARG